MVYITDAADQVVQTFDRLIDAYDALKVLGYEIIQEHDDFYFGPEMFSMQMWNGETSRFIDNFRF